MKVINIFGGPGVGKSTLAAFLFSYLKSRKNTSAELITEFAKDLVYEGQLNTLKIDQLYVFANQNHRMKMIQDYTPNVDFIITDSPLLLSNIYGEINNSIDENFKSFATSIFNSYENINLFISRRGQFRYEEGGRIQTNEEAENVHNNIKKYLNDNNIKYHEIEIVHGFMGVIEKLESILKEDANNK